MLLHKPSPGGKTVIDILLPNGDTFEPTFCCLNLNNTTEKKMESDFVTCRICLEDEEVLNHPLIAPCECTGTNKYVHPVCLETWLDSSYNQKPTHCEMCKSLYKIKGNKWQHQYKWLWSWEVLVNIFFFSGFWLNSPTTNYYSTTSTPALSPIQEASLQTLFCFYDVDHSGFLSVQEIYNLAIDTDDITTVDVVQDYLIRNYDVLPPISSSKFTPSQISALDYVIQFITQELSLVHTLPLIFGWSPVDIFAIIHHHSSANKNVLKPYVNNPNKDSEEPHQHYHQQPESSSSSSPSPPPPYTVKLNNAEIDESIITTKYLAPCMWDWLTQAQINSGLTQILAPSLLDQLLREVTIPQRPEVEIEETTPAPKVAWETFVALYQDMGLEVLEKDLSLINERFDLTYPTSPLQSCDSVSE